MTGPDPSVGHLALGLAVLLALLAVLYAIPVLAFSRRPKVCQCHGFRKGSPGERRVHPHRYGVAYWRPPARRGR